MSTPPKVLYNGTPCTVLAMLENACIIRRECGAQFTVPLNDRLLTVQAEPHEVGPPPPHVEVLEVEPELEDDGKEAFEDENDYIGMGWVDQHGRP